MNAARILREARGRAGLSQSELARRTGVAQPAVARIEGGRSVPRVDTLERLLNACGATLVSEPNLGAGVDRAEIERLLRHSPERRLAEANAPEFRPLTVLRILHARNVRCVVVGAAGARLRGAPVETSTVEIAPEPDPMNRRRLRMAINRLAQGRFRPGRAVPRWSLGPVGSYAALAGAAEPVPVENFTVAVASIDDLIRLARRPHDVEVLGALRQELDRRHTPLR